MHENNIEILRSEAQRLVDMEVNLLNKMLDEPGVIAAAHKGEIQTFDRDSTLKHIEVLAGERTKLDELEMVLAVVGTMKAGKSTSINAIVGTEVLPNRNRPMTALPTLIRHTVGQVEPVLRFENDKPIHRLIDELRAVFQRQETQETIQKLATNPDMAGLIALIQSDAKLNRVHEGADAIFEFLKALNDLVRLCRELNVDFPFADYDEIHELPVIEVEFVHLRETEQSAGRLTLLDTPGPNESGQPHLRKMLKEQLRKASAVLAVLDFQQLKSEADDEVRGELKEIADISKGRLFTLVNKFDQRDRNSDSAEQTKAYVANVLMERQIREEDVFPVSSRWGYLANRARHELFVNERLPDHVGQPWVADFGEEAFGRRWESKIGDPEEVKDSAEKLWEDSLFHAPLVGVIRTAHARAAGFAIDGAAAKLVDMAERIDNLLTTRETALTKSAKVLQEQINALQKDIVHVEASQEKAQDGAKKMLGELADGTKQVFSKVKADAIASLEAYFREGKRIERENFERQLAENRRQREKVSANRGFLAIFSSFLNSASKPATFGEADFDSSNPILKFQNRSDAKDLVVKIEGAVSQIVLQAESTMKAAMNSVLEEFQGDFSGRVLSDAKALIEEMKGRLKDEGFSINLNVPRASMLSLDFSGADMLRDVIGEKSKTVTRKRRQKGVWGTICGWFSSDDWGWEEYETSESYYEIDIRRIGTATLGQIESAFSGLDLAVATYIKKPLNEGINDFFSGFRSTVEQIRGDLLQSIRDQEHSKAEQAALTRRLSDLRKNVPGILTDTRALKQDVEPLIGNCA